MLKGKFRDDHLASKIFFASLCNASKKFLENQKKTKTRKAKVFSGGIKWEHWSEMGYIKSTFL